MIWTNTVWQIPYQAWSNKETAEQVQSGYRMPAPKNCPPEIYELMLGCWHTEPENRPTFKMIYERIVTIWKEKKTINSNTILQVKQKQ